MFGSSNSGIGAYTKVGLETGVAAASPHRLITMLFEGALVAISSAAIHMKAKRILEKGQAISKAITIIDSGLRASLNKEAGGELAERLDALYEYMSRRLLEANLKNNPEMLTEVHGLLMEIKGAWDEIGEKMSNVPSHPEVGKLAGQDANNPQSPALMRV